MALELHLLGRGIDPEEVIINLRENIDLLPANDDMNYLDFDVLTNTHLLHNKKTSEA